jgi:hypothetical protein
VSCQHPDCTQATAGRRRYCREHAANKWAIWRYTQRKREQTAEGLPVGHKHCTCCGKLFRFASGRQQLCLDCRSLATEDQAERERKRKHAAYLRGKRKEPKPPPPVASAMSDDQKAIDRLLRQFIRVPRETLRASA